MLHTQQKPASDLYFRELDAKISSQKEKEPANTTKRLPELIALAKYWSN